MKKSQQPPATRQKNITIVFGYSLFILIVISVIVSTIIPWTNIYFSPHVNQLNALVFMVSLAAGVILPTLISYFLGDRATHVKNKASHHYNGVLFGIAAYWLSLVFAVIGSYTISAMRDAFPSVVLSAIVNGWPILATTIVMIFVAVSYARHQKKKASVMEHTLYQWVLAGSIITLFTLGIINQIMTDFSYLVSILIPMFITVIAILVSYVALRNQPSPPVRLMSAIVATTIGLVALTVATQLAASIFFIGPTITPIFIASGFGLIVWVGYLGIVGRRSARV